ncbi:MAG: hypothetical protein EHM70_22225, partial [Chloroflexota bacterium]
MTDQELIQGNQQAWRLLKLLGEGDAGEVYLVESARDKRNAILKRPHRSSFTADVLRQSTQIHTEASILKSLSDLRLSGGEYHVEVIDLVDQSLPGNELSERFFIVIEKATGVPLSALARLAHFGSEDAPIAVDNLDGDARLYFQKLVETGAVPTLLVLRVLDGLFELLEAIHTRHIEWIDAESFGILWNDIKPDHLFWDPAGRCLSVIDWGNGQFLEQDGITKDRLYSPVDDYRQLIEEMGKFLAETAPNLHASLQWPVSVSPADATPEGLKPLRDRIHVLLMKETGDLAEVRQRETYLVSSGEPSMRLLQELAAVQQQVILYGEMPDYGATARIHARLAGALAFDARLAEFKQVCEQLASLPGAETEQWSTLARIAGVAVEDEQASGLFREAIQDGLNGDWHSVLWTLCAATRNDADPARWRNLSGIVRRMITEISLDTPTPYVTLNRLVQLMEDELAQWAGKIAAAPVGGSQGLKADEIRAVLRAYESLVARLKNEIIKKWPQLDPVPPGANLTYTELDAILYELSDVFLKLGVNPSARLSALTRALSQPRAQTQIIIDA